MVQSIIEGLRNYLAECPLLSEIPLKDRHIDWTAADINGNYGIFADSNDPIGAPYINGDQEMLYTAQINVRKLADSDVKRLEANAWLERLQNWLSDQTEASNFPEMPKRCTPTDIEATNAGMLEMNSKGNHGTYMVQIALTYIKNGG